MLLEAVEPRQKPCEDVADSVVALWAGGGMGVARFPEAVGFVSGGRRLSASPPNGLSEVGTI